jgi:hypothetical protein
MYKFLFGYRFWACAIDEIHYARIPDSQIFRALQCAGALAIMRWGLTATPTLTSPVDLFWIGHGLHCPGFKTDADLAWCRDRANTIRKAQDAARDRRELEGSSTFQLVMASNSPEDMVYHEIYMASAGVMRKRYGESYLGRTTHAQCPPHVKVVCNARGNIVEITALNSLKAAPALEIINSHVFTKQC